MLTYLLKCSISIALFYLFYRWILRGLTFYVWNRVYLVGYAMLSFVLPFISIRIMADRSEVLTRTIPAVYEFSSEVSNGSSNILMYWILVAGMMLMFVRWIFQFTSLQRVKKSAHRSAIGNVVLYDVSQHINPFSFGREIYLNSKLHSVDEINKIIQHEFVHVKQMHTIDLLCAEFVCMINWYNPFAWMLRKAIRENLEFLADEQVLKNGVDPRDYQYLLLKVTGGKDFTLGNQLHFSSLKKRIAMMNKLKSTRAHLVKFLFVLPVICILLLAFRQSTNKHPHGVEVSAPSYLLNVETDTVPTPPTPPAPPVVEKISDNVYSININDHRAVITLKNGKTEGYDLHNAEERAAFERKYGPVPAAPAIPAKPSKPAKPAKPAKAEKPAKPEKPAKDKELSAVESPEAATAVVVAVKANVAVKVGTTKPAVVVEVKPVLADGVTPVDVRTEVDVQPAKPKSSGEKSKPVKLNGQSGGEKKLWPAGSIWAPVKDNC